MGLTTNNEIVKHQDDFLVEILTEELPPKLVLPLAQVFCQKITLELQKENLAFTNSVYYATPRRLAVLVTSLSAAQPPQAVLRKGPARKAAFDAQGRPTPACIGFARSCGTTPDALALISNEQGEWVGFSQIVPGKTVATLLPTIIEQAATTLPIPKRMRWGEGGSQFVRPVLAVILLYGDKVIDATILGKKTSRTTCGHRFLAPGWMTIPHASAYPSLLETEGRAIPDFAKRRDRVRRLATACVKSRWGESASVFIKNEDFLNEVTGLVEWPVALCGEFDNSFLSLPKEVLVSAMQDHQRYFPVVDNEHKLLPAFVVISNIECQDPARILQGNMRVLRARLSDAAFFYANDQKESLEKRLDQLKSVVYHKALGSVYEKCVRTSHLAAWIAKQTHANPKEAARAGLLAKADLTTHMVAEFPELQGTMGHYYAHHDHEAKDVCVALKEQYLPRFSGDELPDTPLGQVLALADKLDSLVGIFGIQQLPTGDKDPYGLRRAALGVLRILIEKEIDLDLAEALAQACQEHTGKIKLEGLPPQVLAFIKERLRAWYLEQGTTSPDVFASVAALGLSRPLDIHHRIQAVKAFKKLPEATALSTANKRVGHIIEKYPGPLHTGQIEKSLFEHEAEHQLALLIETKSELVACLHQNGQYEAILMTLAELKMPIDDFFDHVMVMTEDKAKRENRILLLSKLRGLFLQVADIALLQLEQEQTSSFNHVAERK